MHKDASRRAEGESTQIRGDAHRPSPPGLLGPVPRPPGEASPSPTPDPGPLPLRRCTGCGPQSSTRTDRRWAHLRRAFLRLC